MLGCFLQSYFSGSCRTSWPLLGCIAKTMRVPATSYYLQASPRITLSPGKPYFHPWHFSQWLSALQFGVSLELFILPALSFLGASFFATAPASLFKCLPFLHGSCFLLPSSISRRCSRSSRWTRNEFEGNAKLMLIRIRFPRLFLTLLLLSFVHLPASNAQNAEPFKFFRDYVGLKDDQITAIRNGKAVAKVVESRTPDEVFVFGSVYVQSTPEQYLKLASDIDALRKLPSYLAIRKFSDPPQFSDLDGFTLEAGDIKQLKNCEPGKCDVQLPTEAMDAFKQSVNWSAPDAANQVNRLAQNMALEAIQRYTQGGNAALGTYMDKHHPAVVGETFASLLSRSKALPAYLPELDRYLLGYPEAKSENIQSEFYWEKVNFGLKPTLRIVQAIVYRGPRSTDPAYAVAVKQLYASHYFETALDLTVCVRDQENPDRGFYLITLKGSQQAGLTGLKGGIVRKVAVDKTRSSLERALGAIKQRLEGQPD